MPLQKYRKEWEKIAQFKDWLSENKTDNTKAVCKFCKCELLAKLHDLHRHTKTQKHTHVSVTKMLGIVIRYYSSCNNKIVVTFLGLVEISSGTAVDIVAALIKVLDSLTINIKNLQGIGTDNASVMIGSNNSVYQILKREHKLPNLFLTRCVCHSLQLSLSKATENTLPRNIEFLVNLYRDASGENPFSALCELVKAALSLPHSNADVERLFSHMNIVKNKLRNRLHNNTINSLLYIRYGLKKNNKCCDTYEIPDCTLKLIDTNAVYARATTSNDIALNVHDHDHYDIEMLDLV
ncbi:hypothetical protein RN001_005698 [Aquatica leii]|uniref:HAT C-terminal dimerisation domain-containing protein n=1 Tax=Aquatica leii TaxID=1421715 RepID=A0AAN7Q0N4_9COLE|nr:hypothetical protein RN001_005698 [Aquatica leii]